MSNIDHHDNEARQDMDAVSRAYRAARDSDGMLPPTALDDAIRTAAHRAVHSGPKLAGSSWIRRWTPQLAVAAVVVLSVSVVFVSIEERPDLAPASIQKIALNQSAEPPAGAAAPVQTRIVEDASRAIVAADAFRKKAGAETGAAVGDAQVARQKDAQFAKEERAALPKLAAAPPVYSPPPASPSAAPPPAPASVAAIVAPAPFPAADSTVAPASPVAQGAVALAPMMKRLAPAITANAAAAPARAPVSDAAHSNTQASEAAGIRGFSKEDKLSDKLAEDERPGPWLKRLLELREQDKLKELREQLARFRKAHPDVMLPKVLTELPAE